MRIQVPILALFLGVAIGLLIMCFLEYPTLAALQQQADNLVPRCPTKIGKFLLTNDIEVHSCCRPVSGGLLWFFFVPGHTAESLNVVFVANYKTPEEVPTHE